MKELIARYSGHWAFRVLYKDGRRTYRLSYREAKSLADVYSGRVIYDPWPEDQIKAHWLAKKTAHPVSFILLVAIIFYLLFNFLYHK